jgi:hypothetical protein
MIAFSSLLFFFHSLVSRKSNDLTEEDCSGKMESMLLFLTLEIPIFASTSCPRSNALALGKKTALSDTNAAIVNPTEAVIC